MKNNKLLRLLSILISCLLIIGAVCGIAVAAESASDPQTGNGGGSEGTAAPTATIKYKNLSYGAANQLVFYVETENLPEGATARVLFYNSEKASFTVRNADYVKDSAGTLKVNEPDGSGGTVAVSYDAFLSDEIAPKDMRKPIYVSPVIFDAEGNAIYVGEVLEYSIFEYVIAGFGKNPGEDQKALYSALLDFGASVQKVLLEAGLYSQEEFEKVGYINAYLLVEADVVVGDKVIDTQKYYHGPGEKIDIVAEKFWETEYDLDENGKNDTLAFRGFLDEEGNLIGDTNNYGALKNLTNFKTTASATEIGVAEKVKLSYLLTEGQVITYDSGTLKDNYVSSSLKTEVTPGDKWAFIEDIDATEGVNNVLSTGKNRDGGGQVDVLSTGKNGGAAVRYVYETDMLFIDETGGVGQRYEVYFCNESATQITGTIFYTASGNALSLNRKHPDASSSDGSPSYNNASLKANTLAGNFTGTWHHIRFEAYPQDTLVNDSNPYSKVILNMYIDGELMFTDITVYGRNNTPNDNTTFGSVRLYMTSGSTNNKIYYDNTYVATEYVPKSEVVEPEQPEEPIIPNKYLDHPSTENFDEFTADDYDYSIEAKYGANMSLAPDLSAVDNLSYTTIGTDDDGNKYFEMGMKNWFGAGTSRFPASVTTGDIYVMEFDYMYVGCDQTKDWTTKFTVDNPSGGELFNFTLTAGTNSVSFAGVTLKNGQWYTIRLEYHPNFSDTDTASRFINIYVDGELKTKVNGRQTNDWKKTDAVFGGMGINFRHKGDVEVNNQAFRLDNLFVSAIDLDNKASGEYKDESLGFDYEGDYKELTSDKLGFTYTEGLLGADKTAEDAVGWITVEKDIYESAVLEIAGKGSTASVTTPSPKHDGEKYIFETDLMLSGYTLPTATVEEGAEAVTKALAEISLLGASYDKETGVYTATKAILPIYVKAGENNMRADIYVGGADEAVAGIWTGVWYNLRVEYVVSDIEGADGAVTNAGTYNVYLNGKRVCEDLTYDLAGDVENNLYFGTQIDVTDATLSIDNTYTGAFYVDYKDKGDIANSDLDGVSGENVTVKDDVSLEAINALNKDIYTVELDLRWLGSKGLVEGAEDVWFLEMALANEAGEKFLTLYGKIDPDNFGYLDLSVDKENVIATLPTGTWHNLLIKYVAGAKTETTVDEVTTVTYAGAYELYLNGELLVSGDVAGATDNSTFGAAVINFSDAVAAPEIEADNLFVGSIDLDNHGNGEYADDKATEDYERVTSTIKLDIIASEGLLDADKTLAYIDGWINIVTEETVRTNGWITVEAGLKNVALEIGKKVDVASATFVSAVDAGTDYVFETDIKWMGSSGGIADDTLASAVFFSYELASENGALVTVYGICEAGDYDRVILSTTRNAEDGFATITKDLWYNIRIVYTPKATTTTTGEGDAAVTTTTYSGSYQIFVDGVSVAGASDVACEKDNSKFTGATVTLHYDEEVYDATVRMDNTYTSAITAVEETPETN